MNENAPNPPLTANLLTEQQTVKVTITEYQPPAPFATNHSETEKRGAVRLLAQLAGNVLAAISAHPNYGASIDTETRLLYVHGAYETVTILKVAEAFLRKNGYPILPLQELRTLFKAFRESLLLYHWSPQLHALFAVNPQFGENALLMSREHAEGQPIVEILGKMTVQDQIAGTPHEQHHTSVGSGAKRFGRTIFSVPSTQGNPSGRALYMLRGSSGVKFQTHVTDPAYTTPEVEVFAGKLAVQVNLFAQELEHPSNHAMRDHVIEYSTCGPKAHNARDFGAANVRAVPVDGQGRTETGHGQGCFNCPGGGCTRRTPSRRTATPQVPTRRGTPFPVRARSSAEREITTARTRPTSFSRGMKKRMARNQEKEEVVGKPEVEYLGTKQADGTALPAEGKRIFGGRFVPQTRPGNGHLQNIVKEFIENARKDAKDAEARAQVAQSLFLRREEGGMSTTILDNGGNEAGPSSSGRSPSYHPASPASSHSSMPELGTISESEEEYMYPGYWSHPGNRYEEGEDWHEQGRPNRTPTPY
ncbi:hypothetical protein BDZ89DRAFT_1048783 [Hymenopellis radicata]|nr:hypothetical protein BDZ89DRAFT_1048783 [Hymenopellis radicata]